MQQTLESLKITPEEVDEVAGLGLYDQWAIALYQAIALRKASQLGALLLSQLFLLGLTFIFVLPIGLIVLRNWGFIASGSSNLLPILAPLVLGCIALVCLWDGALWYRAIQVKALARLLNEVKKFNQVLQTILVMSQLDLARQETETEDHARQEILQALTITRESLVNALKVEKILRQQKSLLSRHQEMAIALEENLTTLLSFHQDHPVSDYGRVLNEVLEIGISVHREMRPSAQRKKL